jgi:hypothetical protein
MILHHLGFVVSDIAHYEKHLFFEKKIKEVTDPIQNSKLSLYESFGSCFLELIQPLNEKSFTYNFLKKNGNQFHHLCYKIESEDKLADIVSKQKLILIRGPIPAVLFDNNDVYFYYTRNKQVIEFLIS